MLRGADRDCNGHSISRSLWLNRWISSSGSPLASISPVGRLGPRPRGPQRPSEPSRPFCLGQHRRCDGETLRCHFANCLVADLLLEIFNQNVVLSPLRDSVHRLTRCPDAPPREVRSMRQAVPKYIYEQGLQAARVEFQHMTEPELKSTDFSMFPEARLRVARLPGQRRT